MVEKRIDDEKPWMLAKNNETEELERCLVLLAGELLEANLMLSPFLPETSEKIATIFTGPVTPPEAPLFPKQ